MAVFTSELSGSLLFKSGSTLQASLVPNLGALALTGSLNITGSSLTFNGVDVINRIENIEAGFVDSGSLQPLNIHSASVNIFTASVTIDSASFDSRIDNLNTSTTSNTSAISTLQAATASYYNSVEDLTNLGFITSSNSNIISSSVQISDLGYVTSSLTELPAGTISSSQQILDLGFVTSSNTISASHAINADTASYVLATNINGTVATATTAATASYILSTNIDGIVVSSSYAYTASYIDPTFISASAAEAGFGSGVLPAGTISSSQQISDLGFITSSSEVDLIALGVIHAYTASTDPRLDALEAATSSYATGSHTSIVALNDFTSSYSIDSASFDSRLQNISIDTGSLATDAELLALSASAHIARLQITASAVDTSGLLTTASYQIDSASFNSRIAAINVSGDTAFDGDRVVSNTLLGDLYTDSFNAGTTGSIQDFLTAIFFPSAAPTATFTDQSDNFNTNLADSGSNLVSVSITDTVDESPYTLVLSGTGASSLVAVPQNAASSSWNITAASDLTAGTYNYIATVGDNGGTTRQYSKSIAIAQAGNGTLSSNGTFYIIESATTGPIYLNSNGRTGTQAQVSVSYSPNYGTQAVSSYTSSNALINIASDGKLTVGTPISGSGNLAGSVISSTITWQDQYGNIDSSSIDVNVSINNSPAITETNITSNLNTNLAVSGANLVTISYSDIEGDAINYDSFTFSSPSANLEAVRDNTVYRVRSNNTLSAGTYAFTSSIADVHGFRTTTATHTFNIAQASSGTLTGDTNIYIIESALSGSVFRDATGFNNGNPADLDVTYTTNYGSQVATFTSSNAAIAVNNDGNLTLAVDLSGSVTQSGATFNTTITWNDQYGNQDTAVVTATVFGNQAPAASFTDNGLTEATAISGSDIGTLTVTDVESNSPFTVVLGGTDGDKFNVSGTSSPFSIQPTGSLSTGDYSIQITVTDTYGKQATLNETISVAPAIQTDTIYVYTLPIDNTYNNVTGITGDDGGTPPTPTIAPSYGFFTAFVDNDTLGDSTITVSYGSNFTATLRGSASGNNLDTVLDDLGALTIGGSPASERIFVFIPSGSEMSGVPTSLSTADPGGSSTSGEYVVFVSPDGTFQDSSGGLGNDIKSANIHKLTLDTAVDGYTDWFVIGTEDRFQNSNAYVRIVSTSGSIPT